MGTPGVNDPNFAGDPNPARCGTKLPVQRSRDSTARAGSSAPPLSRNESLSGITTRTSMAMCQSPRAPIRPTTSFGNKVGTGGRDATEESHLPDSPQQHRPNTDAPMLIDVIIELL